MADKEGVKTLSGGAKRLWLRTHISEVKNYHSRYGEGKTLKHFNISSPDVLKTLLRDGDGSRDRRASPLQIAEFESLFQGLNRKDHKATVVVVQLSTGDLMPLLERLLVSSGENGRL